MSHGEGLPTGKRSAVPAGGRCRAEGISLRNSNETLRTTLWLVLDSRLRGNDNTRFVRTYKILDDIR